MSHERNRRFVDTINTRVKYLTIPETQLLVQCYQTAGKKPFKASDIPDAERFNKGIWRKFSMAGYLDIVERRQEGATWRIREEAASRIRKTFGDANEL